MGKQAPGMFWLGSNLYYALHVNGQLFSLSSLGWWLDGFPPLGAYGGGMESRSGSTRPCPSYKGHS